MTKHLRMMGLAMVAVFASSMLARGQNDYAEQRETLVDEHVRGQGVKDPKVLEAMKTVPRHLFVPDNVRDLAYEDRPLPIGHGQTISQPFIVGYMTDIVDAGPESVVLEIGTGSGYQAAVLAQIVKHVYTIEIIPELGKQARTRLESLNYGNVTVKIDDGYHGWKKHAPFDAIVVTAAPAYIPPPLIEQLKEGGKMLIPVGSPFFVQNLMLVEKRDGEIVTRNLMPVRFVPFTRSDEER